MSAEQRPNNPGSNQAPTNHNNNTNTTPNNNNNQNANNNNSSSGNATMNHAAGIPVGMHGMQAGMAGLQGGVQPGMQGAMQAAGMAGAMQAGIASAMQPGMAAGLQANMSSGIRSPVSQVQLIHSPLPGPPYHFSQFPYNPQLMLQNAAVQAAMQAQMSQQLNLAMQGRPPSVGPKSPSLPVLSPSPSSTQAPMSMSGTTTSSPSSTMSTAGGNGKGGKMAGNGNHSNQAHMAAMMGGKATMIPRQPTAQPIVIGQIGVVPGQPVSTAGFLPQGCDPSQLVNSPAGQLRLTSQQQLVTSTGQIITSQPMLTNQAVLQAMASLQQQGIPLAPQPLLNAQTGGLIPSQPLFIRPAGPMAQTQQNMMANAAANSQAVNNMKNQKPMEAPCNPQTKAQNNTPAKTQPSGQPRNLTILPSTSRPGLNTARVYPTSMPSQSQATKLNIPQVTPKLSKIKSRAHSAKSPAVSTASQSKTSTSAVVKPTTTTTTTTSAVVNPNRTPSKSQSESESEASKKASPSTPPAVSVLLPTADQPKSKPTANSMSTAATTITTATGEKKAEEGTAPPKAFPNTAATGCVEERMEVDKAPSRKKEVVVEKQRAIVKPHILTHVIEGFVIQEGPEPFPHDNHNDAKDSEDDQSPYAFRDPTPDEMLGQGDAAATPLPAGPSQHATLKCEFCGNVTRAEKFRCSKRFCSMTCAKRYNVGCSRRLSLFKAAGSKDGPGQSKHLTRSVSMPAGRCMRKRKPSGLRMRRGWRSGRGGRMSLSSQPLEDNSSSRSEHESSSSVGSPSPPQELEMETDEPSAQGAPNKWTVQEVFDFIASITGCATYAEEFRAQEIDGQALMLLKEDHLMTTMNMKLGPALKICARINSLKDDYV